MSACVRDLSENAIRNPAYIDGTSVTHLVTPHACVGTETRMQYQVILECLRSLEAWSTKLTFETLLIAMHDLLQMQRNAIMPEREENIQVKSNFHRIRHNAFALIYHMHFQCSFGVQWDAANVADVLCGVVDILVSLHSRLIFESLITVGEESTLR